MAEVQVARHLCISSMVKHFESLPDPRHERNRRHLLVEVIVIAICGVIVGCSGPTAMARWVKAKKDWLQEVLTLPQGVPVAGLYSPSSDRAQTRSVSNLFSVVDRRPGARSA